MIGVADDIITYSANEIEHDRNFLTLCETARINGLKLNAKKLQFKSMDCKFFGHKLNPQGLKADEDKVEAIVHMQPPKTETELKEFPWHGELPGKIHSNPGRVGTTMWQTVQERHDLEMGSRASKSL